MKSKVFKTLALLLGLFMIAIGLNKFLVFTAIPNPPGDGGALMEIYLTSGFLKLVGILEILGGIALLMHRFVPLGLVLITAIMFNATTFHALHDPSGIGPAAVSLGICLILIYAHKARFSVLWSS